MPPPLPKKKKKTKKELKAEAEEVKYNTLDEAYLRNAFNQFDKDGSGYLEKDEALAALTMLGSKLSFEDLDVDSDARVSFEEFSVSARRRFELGWHAAFSNKAPSVQTRRFRMHSAPHAPHACHRFLRNLWASTRTQFGRVRTKTSPQAMRLLVASVCLQAQRTSMRHSCKRQARHGASWRRKRRQRAFLGSLAK